MLKPKKVLVFGGVYSNLQALKKMQNIASELDIDPNQIICTGDVVGYCAQPEECVQTIMDWGIHCVAGNVEIQLRDNQQDCGCDFKEGSRCDSFSNLWYPYAQTQLSASSINWMKSLPDFLTFQYANLNGVVLHGTYFETAGYVFKSTLWKIKESNFEATNAQLILAGHCGLPFNDKKAPYQWLNAGVIGMPANDGTPRVWYMILEVDNNGELISEHHSFHYDYLTTSKLMLANQLPKEYAQTLQTGIWDNCEILPEEETVNQGEEMLF